MLKVGSASVVAGAAEARPHTRRSWAPWLNRWLWTRAEPPPFWRSEHAQIEAFEVAWSLGTVPEADLRTTRDRVIVAFHDNDFKRILPNAWPEIQKRGIQDLTWAEVRELDIGEGDSRLLRAAALMLN
jgi:glycerophosphoryl diester phosphodiesterase